VTEESPNGEAKGNGKVMTWQIAEGSDITTVSSGRRTATRGAQRFRSVRDQGRDRHSGSEGETGQSDAREVDAEITVSHVEATSLSAKKCVFYLLDGTYGLRNPRKFLGQHTFWSVKEAVCNGP
jgi:hypothetical protein